MNSDRTEKDLEKAISAQQTKAKTDRRDTQLEKSKGNEISRTGRDISTRATVGLSSEQANDNDPKEQNGSGGV